MAACVKAKSNLCKGDAMSDKKNNNGEVPSDEQRAEEALKRLREKGTFVPSAFMKEARQRAQKALEIRENRHKQWLASEQGQAIATALQAIVESTDSLETKKDQLAELMHDHPNFQSMQEKMYEELERGDIDKLLRSAHQATLSETLDRGGSSGQSRA